VLRYDLTLPLLLSVRWTGTRQELRAAGKVYRVENESSTHLEAFHQLELFAADVRGRLDVWAFAGRILEAVDRLVPQAEVRISPTDYPMCARAFTLDVHHEGDWREIMAWGEYADWVLRGIAPNPSSHVAIGAGFGLERAAGLRFGIRDVRQIAGARVDA